MLADDVFADLGHHWAHAWWAAFLHGWLFEACKWVNLDSMYVEYSTFYSPFYAFYSK